MASFIYMGMSAVFGGGLVEDVAEFMDSIINALLDFFASGTAKTALTLLIPVGVAMLTIFFVMHIIDASTKNMLSSEQLMLMFAKYFIGMFIMVFIVDIVIGLFGFSAGLYALVADGLTTNSVGSDYIFFGLTNEGGGGGFPTKYTEDVAAVFEENLGSGISGFVDGAGLLLSLIVPLVLYLVALLAAYFVTVSNAINLIVRGIYAPIGVVQLFDEGTRSSGIRYLKKFAADAILYAVIMGILWAAGQLNFAITGSLYTDFATGHEISWDQAVNMITGLSTVARLLVVQASAIGAILGAQKLTSEIMGA